MVETAGVEGPVATTAQNRDGEPAAPKPQPPTRRLAVVAAVATLTAAAGLALADSTGLISAPVVPKMVDSAEKLFAIGVVLVAAFGGVSLWRQHRVPVSAGTAVGLVAALLLGVLLRSETAPKPPAPPARTTTPHWSFGLDLGEAVRFVNGRDKPVVGDTSDGKGGDIVYLADMQQLFFYQHAVTPAAPTYEQCHTAAAMSSDMINPADPGDTARVLCRSELRAGVHAIDMVTYFKVSDVSGLPAHVEVEVWFEYPAA